MIEAIDPAKDVDGFHPINAGRLIDRRAGPRPLHAARLPAAGRNRCGAISPGLDAVVVGRSNIVGKPMAQLLLRRELHRDGRPFAGPRIWPMSCRRADILVAAVGRPEMVRGDWIKPGAIVIDVGINRVPNPAAGEGKTRLVGDVGLRGGGQGRRRDHAGAGRRRPDDHRLPAAQHARGGLPPARAHDAGGGFCEY